MAGSETRPALAPPWGDGAARLLLLLLLLFTTGLGEGEAAFTSTLGAAC